MILFEWIVCACNSKFEHSWFTSGDVVQEQLFENQIQAIFNKYHNYPSVTKNRKKAKPNENFVFYFVLESNILKLLRNLKPRQASQIANISV